MNKYSRSKIYTIRHPSSSNYYIDSTYRKTLPTILCYKKKEYGYLEGSDEPTNCLFEVFKYPHDALYIEIIELFPCNSSYELKHRRNEIIRQYVNENKVKENMVIKPETMRENLNDILDKIQNKKNINVTDKAVLQFYKTLFDGVLDIDKMTNQ